MCYLQDLDGLAQTQIDIQIKNVSNKAKGCKGKWDFKAIQIKIGTSKQFVSKMTSRISKRTSSADRKREVKTEVFDTNA